MKNVAPVIVRTPLPVGLEGLGTQGTQDRVEAMLGISGPYDSGSSNGRDVSWMFRRCRQRCRHRRPRAPYASPEKEIQTRKVKAVRGWDTCRS